MSTNDSDKTIIITGGTGGIGLHSALGIAKRGVRLVVTGRNAERGEEARARIAKESGNDKIELATADISSVAGVQQLAADLLARFPEIDVLVNNAGYLGSEPKTSADGLEMHFAVNVAAPYLLTHALLPALRAAAPARVLNLTGGSKATAVDVDNLQAEKGFKGLTTYSHSKSVMEAMSMALARELEPQGVYVNVIYPGAAATSMTRAMSLSTLPGPMKLLYPLFKLMLGRDDGGKSAAKAARSSIWAATTPDLDKVSGQYFDSDTKNKKLHATVYDEQVQERVLALIPRAEPAATS